MFNIHFSIERWKFNKEYGVYVSTEGRFKDENKKPIIPAPAHKYLRIVLNGQTINAHRLVLETFCPVEDKSLTVDHIDHNTRNNALKNLRWLTAKDNANDLEYQKLIENLKNQGIIEYLKGIRPAPSYCSPKMQKISSKMQKLKETTSFDLCKDDNNVIMQGIGYDSLIKILADITNMSKSKIRHYIDAYMVEGKKEQKRFGFLIRLYYA